MTWTWTDNRQRAWLAFGGCEVRIAQTGGGTYTVSLWKPQYERIGDGYLLRGAAMAAGEVALAKALHAQMGALQDAMRALLDTSKAAAEWFYVEQT